MDGCRPCFSLLVAFHEKEKKCSGTSKVVPYFTRTKDITLYIHILPLQDRVFYDCMREEFTSTKTS